MIRIRNRCQEAIDTVVVSYTEELPQLREAAGVAQASQYVRGVFEIHSHGR
jgi:hypothetical protein